MSIATKNGSIIIKDGKLAESCGCCGGWYCCADKACLAKPSSVTLSIVAEDFYAQHLCEDNFGGYQSSVCFFGSAINGTHTLTSIAPTGGYSSAWQKTFAAAPSGCAPSVFTLELSANSRITFADFFYRFTGPVFYYASESAVKSKDEMSCGAPASGIEQAYFRGTPLNATTSWSSCDELPFTHTRSFNLDPARLIASRSFDAFYATRSIAINQTTGSGVGSITVTLNQ